MPFSYRVPVSGRVFTFPDSVDKDEARLSLIREYPEEFPEYEAPEGFVPGLQSGIARLGGVLPSIQAGIGGITGDEEAFRSGLEGVERAQVAATTALPQPVSFFEHEDEEGVVRGPSVEKHSGKRVLFLGLES